uniref:Uncharacterized protein n=2 Tax=Rangifer tarandus platyrhynchus TaxID=3082113 RepID=A0ACB0EJD3_RANTA|nr:unnamed protein product [Rangifer tarandus platyrhynchus]
MPSAAGRGGVAPAGRSLLSGCGPRSRRPSCVATPHPTCIPAARTGHPSPAPTCIPARSRPREPSQIFPPRRNGALVCCARSLGGVQRAGSVAALVDDHTPAASPWPCGDQTSRGQSHCQAWTGAYSACAGREPGSPPWRLRETARPQHTASCREEESEARGPRDIPSQLPSALTSPLGNVLGNTGGDRQRPAPWPGVHSPQAAGGDHAEPGGQSASTSAWGSTRSSGARPRSSMAVEPPRQSFPGSSLRCFSGSDLDPHPLGMAPYVSLSSPSGGPGPQGLRQSPWGQDAGCSAGEMVSRLGGGRACTVDVGPPGRRRSILIRVGGAGSWAPLVLPAVRLRDWLPRASAPGPTEAQRPRAAPGVFAMSRGLGLGPGAAAAPLNSLALTVPSAADGLG